MDVIVVPLCNLVPLIHSSACLTNLMFLVSFIFHLFHKFYTNTIVFFFLVACLLYLFLNIDYH